MKLNELKPNAGATANRKRVGRGIGSGTGKTAGRGYKGQKSRSGVSIQGFEGGQMPIYMRMPKRGFTSRNRLNLTEINLSALQTALDSKALKSTGIVTEADLAQAGVIRKVRDGVRILGRGSLTGKISLKVTGITETARQAIEKAGGSVELIVHKSAKQEADKEKRAKKLAAKAK